MADDVPLWVNGKQVEYQSLERERAALQNGFAPLAMCRYLTGAGILMFVGVTFFHSESPFYAGAGMTLAVIFGGRWWWLHSEFNRILKRQIQLSDQALAGGFLISGWDGIRVAPFRPVDVTDVDASAQIAAPEEPKPLPMAPSTETKVSPKLPKSRKPQFTEAEIFQMKHNRKPWLTDRR